MLSPDISFSVSHPSVPPTDDPEYRVLLSPTSPPFPPRTVLLFFETPVEPDLPFCPPPVRKVKSLLLLEK